MLIIKVKNKLIHYYKSNLVILKHLLLKRHNNLHMFINLLVA